MFLLLLWFSLALGISFLCSLLEAVILSVHPAYIETLARTGRRSGVILRDLKDRLDRPLAAILTVNTIAHTVGAAGVGAQSLQVFGQGTVAITSAVLTVCILVLSEIIPKTLGANYWRILGPMSGYTIKGLIVLTWPAVVLSERLSQLMARNALRTSLTREEMIAVAEQGETEGALLRRETRIIKNLVRLDNIYVEDIMTPRAVILAMQKNLTVAEAVALHRPIPFSRVPVYDKDLDDIVGFTHRYRILEATASGRGNTRLGSMTRPLQPILPTATVAHVLEEFIRRRQHVFLVVDEYGGTAGLVTLEDAVETLLGVEIVDEYDSVADMRQLARSQWEQRKREHLMDLDDFRPGDADAEAEDRQ